jgi:hypothetical protein
LPRSSQWRAYRGPFGASVVSLPNPGHKDAATKTKCPTKSGPSQMAGLIKSKEAISRP